MRDDSPPGGGKEIQIMIITISFFFRVRSKNERTLLLPGRVD
jgi:hypothetical protein